MDKKKLILYVIVLMIFVITVVTVYKIEVLSEIKDTLEESNRITGALIGIREENLNNQTNLIDENEQKSTRIPE